MKKILGIIVVIVAIIGIGNLVNTQKPAQPGTPTTSTDKPHAKDFTEVYGNNPRNTITVKLPTTITAETPYILFMHGGAWTSGDKKDIAIVQAVLASQGIASGAINYRYASAGVHYPELMKDVDAAVSYSLDHFDEWGLSGKTMSIGGISAGAHMALLYSYAYDKRGHINAVISMAGPTDLTAADMLDTAAKNQMIRFVNWLVDGTYTSGKPLSNGFAAASPIKHIKNVPTLIIQGNKDTIVLYNQSVALDSALTDQGIAHKFITIPNANHDLGLANQATAAKITAEVTNWIKKYNK